MSKKDVPMTSAVRCLISHGIDFEGVTYAYEDKGGTRVSSRELGVDEHQVIKTLIMETQNKEPLVVLMHGDREVSVKTLARSLGIKSIGPCDPKTAQRHSGYQVGGTSPFGLKKPMPVYVESSILALDRIYINGGKRGFLVRIDPRDLDKVLEVTEVQVAI